MEANARAYADFVYDNGRFVIIDYVLYHALCYLQIPPDFVVRSLESPRSQDLQVKKPIVGW